MKGSGDLRSALRSIDRRSYPAYKSLTGAWSFGDYVLSIDHVQGDPFAAPSRLSVQMRHDRASFPPEYRETRENRRALADYLLRRFGLQADRFRFQAKGSGKSGLLSVSRPGQEVLERTACSIGPEEITLRFEVGFPANGRTINAYELEKILFDFLPVCVAESLTYVKTPKEALRRAVFLAEDQLFIRRELERLGLAAFVADGAVLPRESGVSDRPMKNAVPFRSPDAMAVTLDLPHLGKLRGMGVKTGITVIAGGGYHGKSTLLKALERGVYDHVAGDGREYVITDPTAVKIRAEDGRKITDVDVSLFINHLPSGGDTTHFSTLDASGSTSQAANIIEAVEAGSRLLLIDEDTSATNLMVRDELMTRVISRDKEPITPFLERASDLYEKAGVSIILVVGSCGAYFHLADQIIQMDAYRAVDITSGTKALLADSPVPRLTAPDFRLPDRTRRIDLSGATQTRRSYRGDKVMEERLKIKRLGRTAFALGREELDLRYVEQLVDEEQTQALAVLLRYAKENFGTAGAGVRSVADALVQLLEQKGLAGACGRDVPSGLAMPRVQEIFACLNRY